MTTLNIAELNRYSRQMLLEEIGPDGQLALKQARVLVIGAGGIGCPVLQYLNAAGIGTLGIIDADKVELHNLHRQILYSEDDLGRSKVTTAVKKLRSANPYVQYEIWDEFLSPGNARDIIRSFDLVVDGSDNFSTRYLVGDNCALLNIPLVYGSIFRSEGQMAVFNYKGSKGLRDLFPEPPDPSDVPNCSEIGVLGIVPGIIGSLMCDLAIKVILGQHVPVDRLFVFDTAVYNLRTLAY